MQGLLTGSEIIAKGIVMNTGDSADTNEAVGPSSVDLRLGEEASEETIYHDEGEVEYEYTIERNDGIVIDSDGFYRLSTFETINMPDDVAGKIHLRSTFSREGLVMSGGFVDAGYEGPLTISVHNVSPTPIEIDYRERFCQLECRTHDLTDGYDGQYGGEDAGVQGSQREEGWDAVEAGGEGVKSRSVSGP